MGETLSSTLPSQITTLGRRCTHFERISDDFEQLKIAVGDLISHSRHFLESHNGDFRLVLTTEGDVSVWRRGGKKGDAQRRREQGESAYRVLCWHAGVGGRAP